MIGEGWLLHHPVKKRGFDSCWVALLVRADPDMGPRMISTPYLLRILQDRDTVFDLRNAGTRQHSSMVLPSFD
jgi:hypothetical protein